MGDPIIRLRNVLALCKAETVPGVDAVPTAAVDAFPFEIDSLTIGSPYTSEDSNEATGTDIGGAPVIIGQATTFVAKMRLKGAGALATYSASIKPPSHALLQSCGLRGVFTAAVAATALASGTVTSATLAAPYGATAGLYRGQRLVIAGAPQAGAHPMIAEYSAARAATLTDVFGTALAATNTAEIKPNWTYAPTSPATAAERVADQPSSTVYCHVDGILYKLFGMRGNAKISGDTSKPLYLEVTGTCIWGGQSNVAQPTNAVVANHAAPVLNMNAAISAAFAVNRKLLPVSQFSYDFARQIESFEDPNTALGFGDAQIGGRSGMLECDPYKHADLSVRNHLADLEAAIGGAASMIGVVRAGSVSGNRVALTLPSLIPMKVEMATRKIAASENLGYRALSSGRDASGRDGDAILCFD
jgi:hypothetical protein